MDTKMNTKNNIQSILSSKTREFCSLFFKNPFFDVLALIFIVGKIAANLIMGASWANALRSGFTGCLFYILGCYAIHMLSGAKDAISMPDNKMDISILDVNTDNKSDTSTLDGNIDKSARNIFMWLVILQIILTLTVMHSQNIISFQVPVWGQINSAWSSLVKSMINKFPHIEATGLIGWPYLILYILVPLILVRKNSAALPEFFGLKTSKAALPFVILYTAAFVFIKGISLTNLLTLMFVIIWPALGEEFLYRGIIQKTLVNATKNPITGIVLTSFLFTVSHIPSYFLGYYNSPVLAFSSLLPVLFTSFFWGYGFYRTKVLWPWILIHALSDIAGF